jgi:hypothetical protein
MAVAKSAEDKYAGARDGYWPASPLELVRVKEETEVALRKLLEAKDAAVRAALCIT